MESREASDLASFVYQISSLPQSNSTQEVDSEETTNFSLPGENSSDEELNVSEPINIEEMRNLTLSYNRRTNLEALKQTGILNLIGTVLIYAKYIFVFFRPNGKQHFRELLLSDESS